MQTSFADIVKQPFTLMQHLCEMPNDIQYNILSFVNNIKYKDYQNTYWAKQLPKNFIKNVRRILISKHPQLYFNNPSNVTVELYNIALTQYRGIKFSIMNDLNNNNNETITQNNILSCVNNNYNDYDYDNDNDDNNNVDIKPPFTKKEKPKYLKCSDKIIQRQLLKKTLRRQRIKSNKQCSKIIKSDSIYKFKNNNIDNLIYDKNNNWFTLLICQYCCNEYYVNYKYGDNDYDFDYDNHCSNCYWDNLYKNRYNYWRNNNYYDDLYSYHNNDYDY